MTNENSKVETGNSNNTPQNSMGEINEKTKQMQDLSFIEHTPSKTDVIIQACLKWAIGGGRKIVILVQIVVLTVFVYRFKADREFNELKESIDNKQIIVENLQDVEQEQRRLIRKIDLLADFTKSQINWKAWMDEFTEKIPQTLQFHELSLTKETAILRAETQSVQAFAVFVNILLNDDNVDSVVLTSSKYRSEDKIYEFTLEFDLANVEFYSETSASSQPGV